MICLPLNFRSSFISVFLFALLLFLPGSASAVNYDLTVQNGGAGTGNVTDVNNSVVHLLTPGASYLTTFPAGTSVKLTPNPNWTSTFDGWGAPCVVTGNDCTLTLNSALTLSANFSLNMQAIIVGHSVAPNYATLTDAYAAADALTTSTISANVYTFYETLTLSRPISVKFYLARTPGAYYSATPSGVTTLVGDLILQNQLGFAEVEALTIQGSLIVSQGTVSIKSLTIM